MSYPPYHAIAINQQHQGMATCSHPPMRRAVRISNDRVRESRALIRDESRYGLRFVAERRNNFDASRREFLPMPL